MTVRELKEKLKELQSENSNFNIDDLEIRVYHSTENYSYDLETIDIDTFTNHKNNTTYVDINI